MSLFKKFQMGNVPQSLEVQTLPVEYSSLTSANRYLVRERYAREQGNACWYCDYDLDGEPRADVLEIPITASLFPSNFFSYPIHLHHDHHTDMTIGAVHAQCNAVLWQRHGE